MCSSLIPVAYNQFQTIKEKKARRDQMRKIYKSRYQAIAFRMSQLSTKDDFLLLDLSEDAGEAAAALELNRKNHVSRLWRISPPL